VRGIDAREVRLREERERVTGEGLAADLFFDFGRSVLRLLDFGIFEPKIRVGCRKVLCQSDLSKIGINEHKNSFRETVFLGNDNTFS